MGFPVYIHVFGLRIHPHLLFELLAYFVGFQLYLQLRKRYPKAAVSFEQNMWLIVGCVFGALVGSKVLAVVESWPSYWEHRDQLVGWLGGKTIVGGFLGGWGGVEIAKKFLGIRHSTGDAFVFPLITGTAIGRVGCFLTGLADKTYGTATAFPWGIDFGDGVRRHPTQLYEIAWVFALAIALWVYSRRNPQNGRLFRWFMAGYLLFRLLVEFIKPTWKPLAGLSPIQYASLVGVFVCLWQLYGAPAFNAVSGKDASRKVGEFSSKRPIRVNLTTRDDVMRVLGPPQYATTDMRRIAYSWTTLKGLWVGICFGVQKDESKRTIVLSFDATGLLRSFDLLQSDSSFLFGGPARHWVPEGLAPYPAAVPPASTSSPPPPSGPVYRTDPR